MKKDLNYYLRLPYKLEIIEDKDDGGFVASYPDLPGCLTSGDTIEECVSLARDAKKLWLESALKDKCIINEPDEIEEYSGNFRLRMPKSLHKSLAEHSKREGISMNQYCIFLLSKNDALLSR